MADTHERDAAEQQRGDLSVLADWLESSRCAIRISGPPKSGVSSLGSRLAGSVVGAGDIDTNTSLASSGVTFVDERDLSDDLVYGIKRAVDDGLDGRGILFVGPPLRAGGNTHRLAGRTLSFETFGLRIADRAGHPQHDPLVELFEAQPRDQTTGSVDLELLRSSRLPGADVSSDFFVGYLELLRDRAGVILDRACNIDEVVELLASIASGTETREDRWRTDASLLGALGTLKVVMSCRVFDPERPFGATRSVSVMTDPGFARHVLSETGESATPGWLDTCAALVDLHSHAVLSEAEVQVSFAANQDGPQLYIEHERDLRAVTVALDGSIGGVLPFEPSLKDMRSVVLTSDEMVSQVDSATLSMPISVLWAPLDRRRLQGG